MSWFTKLFGMSGKDYCANFEKEVDEKRKKIAELTKPIVKKSNYPTTLKKESNMVSGSHGTPKSVVQRSHSDLVDNWISSNSSNYSSNSDSSCSSSSDSSSSSSSSCSGGD